MIIPKVSAAPFEKNSTGAKALIARLNHWSLFHSLALTDIDDWDIKDLKYVTRMISGKVDLEIELKKPQSELAIPLLNAGANSVIGDPADSSDFAEVPLDRIKNLVPAAETTVKSGDLMDMESPNVEKLLESEEKDIECLVDVEYLEIHPDFIVNYFRAMLRSDRPDGLWSTVIIDTLGQCLGLAYSNEASLLDAVANRRGTYWSRSRNELWIKGKSSGAQQRLVGIRMDCDHDCLRFQVEQKPPGFCHKKTHACFGQERTIATVVQRLEERLQSSDEKSFTKILVNDPEMLRTKLLEEAEELSDAESGDDIAWEAADVLYFSLVKLVGNDVKLEQVFHELARRMNRVVRRKNKLVE